ncbi:MAG: hypothetical protein ACRC6U_06705 [Fusobacteriaceae bacterium]
MHIEINKILDIIKKSSLSEEEKIKIFKHLNNISKANKNKNIEISLTVSPKKCPTCGQIK